MNSFIRNFVRFTFSCSNLDLIYYNFDKIYSIMKHHGYSKLSNCYLPLEFNNYYSIIYINYYYYYNYYYYIEYCYCSYMFLDYFGNLIKYNFDYFYQRPNIHHINMICGSFFKIYLFIILYKYNIFQII